MGHPIDLDGDGVIEANELAIYHDKVKAKRRMAFLSLSAIFVVTLILLTPLVSTERVAALSEVISMFYFMMGSIVGTFMGVSAWMGSKYGAK